MTPYLRSLDTNLSHLRILIPPQPRRNLAAWSGAVPYTEEDTYLESQINWAPIPPGRAGTKVTLQTMAELARQAAGDPRFTTFVLWNFAELRELEEWTREHFVYRDEGEEIIRTPLFMLQDMGRTDHNRTVGLEGDCDDVSAFLAAAAKTLQYPARLVAIRYDQSNPDFEHVFTQAFDGGQWVTLDPTVDAGTTMNAIDTLTEYV